MKLNLFFVGLASCFYVLVSARYITLTESDATANNVTRSNSYPINDLPIVINSSDVNDVNDAIGAPNADINGDVEDTISENCSLAEENITNEVQLDSHVSVAQSALIQLLLRSDVGTISDKNENDINNSGSNIQPTDIVVVKSTTETPESQTDNPYSHEAQIDFGDFVADEDFESVLRRSLIDSATEKSTTEKTHSSGDYVSNDEEFDRILERLGSEAKEREMRNADTEDTTKRVHGTVTQEPEIEICPICLEDLDQEMNFLTLCNHRMHYSCHKKYILHGGSNKVSKSYKNHSNH